MSSTADKEAPARALTRKLADRDLCNAFTALHGNTEGHAPVLRRWLVDEMQRRAGAAAVDRWLDAESAAGCRLDPFPILFPASY